MMKFMFLILTVCGLVCAQGTETEENEDFSCGDHCRATLHCPSTLSILLTVRTLPNDCRECIVNECGSRVTRENVTEVAECMFWARSGCEQCELSNASLVVRGNCQNCTLECENQLESGITPTMPPNVFRPIFVGRRPRPRRVRRPTFIRRRFRPHNRFPQGRRVVITTTCRCESPAMCPNAGETNKMMANQSVSCRDCVEEACAQEAQGDRSGLPQCIRDARQECSGCTSMTNAERARMENCRRCVRRCQVVTRRPNVTSAVNCDRPCNRPDVCPSTEAIIATIGRTSQQCQDCITEQCGEVTDRDRDGSANCMFQARATCNSCRLGPFERAQRDRCSRCRKECENDESETEAALTPDGSGEAQESAP